MKKAIYIVAALALLSGCRTGGDGAGGGSMDWHLFRGNGALDGYTDTRLPRDPVLLWSYRSDSPTISSPVLDDGTTYWSDRRGHIRGVDIDGEPAFDLDLDTSIDATPMIHQGTLYIGRMDGFMTAVSLEDGTTLWEYETMGQISASPGITDFEGRKALVFGSYDCSLYCLDAFTGGKITSYESGYYLNGAVAIRDNTAVVGGCDGWIRVIDTLTGIQTDSLLSDSYIPASPAIWGDYCYIGDHSGNIYELLLGGGRIVSHRKIMEAPDDSASLVSVPAVTSRELYVLSDDRHLYSLDRRTGEVRWKYLLKGRTGESSPVVARDRVIACTKTGIVTILDTDTGEALWEYDTGETITASPAVVEGRFLVLTAKGTLLCFGAAGSLQKTGGR
jgi:outer membrane protein assembly factor BamB